MSDKYTLGKLREFTEGLPDDIPILVWNMSTLSKDVLGVAKVESGDDCFGLMFLYSEDETEETKS